MEHAAALTPDRSAGQGEAGERPEPRSGATIVTRAGGHGGLAGSSRALTLVTEMAALGESQLMSARGYDRCVQRLAREKVCASICASTIQDRGSASDEQMASFGWGDGVGNFAIIRISRESLGAAHSVGLSV